MTTAQPKPDWRQQRAAYLRQLIADLEAKEKRFGVPFAKPIARYLAQLNGLEG